MDKYLAIYMRVSSKQQDTKSQQPDLERWAKGQDDSIVWYKDRFTGKSMDRPGWLKLEKAMQSGEVSRVVVWRLDRLGRTAKGLTALFEDLRERGIGLISLKDGLDLSTAAGRLMANVLASVAEFETEVRAERVRAGHAVARAAGKVWGGSKPGWHWKVSPEQIRLVKRMKQESEPITAIAKAVGLSRPTIYKILEG